MKTKNLQNDQKIFFVGLNKNATTTFYNFFERNGYFCEDSTNWWDYCFKKQFKAEVFTDGYELKYRNSETPKFTYWPNIEFLNKTFPNSYYILQTRPIKDWLLSRQLKYAAGTEFNKNKIDKVDVLKKIHEDYVIRLFYHQKLSWETNIIFSETARNFKILDISLPNNQLVDQLEDFLQVKFKDRLLIEKNRTTWIDDEVKNFYDELVIEYLSKKKYEI